MTTINQIHSPLNGAIGSDFSLKKNRLYIAEYSGKISTLDLIQNASSTAVSTGIGEVRGTWSFDFDLGKEAATTEQAIRDIWWEQKTSAERQITPRNSAKIAYIGHVNFNSVSAADLQNLTYTTTSINGNDDSSNLLTPGAMFGVKTSAGHYAKVQVVSYGYNLQLKWRTYKLASPYKVIGTGYTHLEDIVLSSDENFAYATERSGNLLRVDLSSANRSAATVISSGMTAPHQISLDEDHGYAFVVEYAASGNLIRIDLNTGAQTIIHSNLNNAIGLLVTSDLNFAYISEQSSSGGRLIKVNLTNSTQEIIVTGMDNPFFLTWADPSEGGILTTERDPANRVAMIDLTQSPVTVSHVVTGIASRPSSVAVANPYKLLVCSDNQVNELLLTESTYNALGPLLLGVGHVPISAINSNGYATTDSSYFFKVKDAPFGGALSLMFNHEKANALGAKFYRITIDSSTDAQDDPWTDYKWSTSLHKFKPDTQTANHNGMFRIRKANSLWYNHWLGYRLNTAALSNGKHTVKVSLYATSAYSSKLSDEDSFEIMVDNSWPRASINSILHYINTTTYETVNTCGIVTTPTTNFKCNITAFDNEGHLKSWRLSVLWGNNKSMLIGSHEQAGVWNGITDTAVPSTPKDLKVVGDPTSTHCAHTFYLTVWDKVINGYNHIHRSQYHKSITLMIE